MALKNLKTGESSKQEIQTNSSEVLELQQVVQEQMQTIQDLQKQLQDKSDTIVKMSKSDENLKNLRRERSEWQSEIQKAREELTDSTSKLEKRESTLEYNEKKYEEKEKQLEEKIESEAKYLYRQWKMKCRIVLYSVFFYGVIATVLQGIKNNVFWGDCRAVGVTIWNTYKDMSADASKWLHGLADWFIITPVTYVVIFILGVMVLASVGYGIYWLIDKMWYYIGYRTVPGLLIPYMIMVWFDEPIKNLIKINLLIVLVIIELLILGIVKIIEWWQENH